MMSCRSGCAACCIAPSISSVIVGMPNGKIAGERCIQLDENLNCLLFNDLRRPAVCSGLKPSLEMCGTEVQGREYALTFLTRLELITTP